MRIIQIAQMIDATAPHEERLKGAVQKALEGKSIADASEIYGVPAEELSKEVSDARKLRSFPVEEILAARNVRSRQKSDGRPGNKPTATEIAKTLGLNPVDVSWVIRKSNPKEIIKLLSEEKDEILRLHDAGNPKSKIARDTLITVDTVRDVIRTNRGPSMASPKKNKDIADQVFLEFSKLIEAGIEDQKARTETLSKFPGLTREALSNMLYNRGHKIRDVKPYSFSEYLEAKKMMYENPEITLTAIAEKLGRPREPLGAFLNKTDPRWYSRNISSRNLTPEAKNLIREMAYSSGETNYSSMAAKLSQQLGYSYHPETISDFVFKDNPQWYEKNDRSPIREYVPAIASAVRQGWPIDYSVDTVVPKTSPIRKMHGYATKIKDYLSTEGIDSYNVAHALHPAFHDDVVADAASGTNRDKIAAKYGIHPSTVSNILRRKKLNPQPYDGKELSSPSQKETYLKWRLGKIDKKTELDLYDAFDIDFEPGSVNPDAPTPDVNELFQQVGLPPLQPRSTPPAPAELQEQPADQPAFAPKTISREEYERRRKNFVTKEQFQEMCKERESVATFNLAKWIRRHS